MSELRKYNFLIVGTLRNCSRTIVNEVRRLNKVFDSANSVSWLLVESDSVDATNESLILLKSEIPNFDFICLGQLIKEYPERERRIAFCRDAYVKEIRKRPEYSIIDYVVVVDLDGMCSQLTKEGVESCWNKKGWTACFANQPGGYYDLWALRHNNWCPNDPFETYRDLIKSGVDAAKAYKTSVIDKLLKIKPESEWIQLESAFGGLAIYKFEAFKWADYSKDGEYPPNICEHTTFNQKLREKDFELYINPSLINIKYSSHIAKMKFKYILLKIFGHSLFEKIKMLLLK